MNVTVTDNKMNTVTYGYAPEHFAGVVEFYSNLVQSGEIYTYTVKMQRVDLTYPKIWARAVDNLWTTLGQFIYETIYEDRQNFLFFFAVYGVSI